MPGHVKKGGEGDDPDPKPYLVISIEMKKENAMKPYDPKKSYWTPDGKGGYLEGILDSDDGTKAVVICGHEVRQNTLSILWQNVFFCKIRNDDNDEKLENFVVQGVLY